MKLGKLLHSQAIYCALSVLLWLCCTGPNLMAASYQYDSRQRLAVAILENGKQIAYTYDAAGNITAVSVSNAALPAAPQLSGQSSATGISLSWVSVPDAAVYDIWRATGPSCQNPVKVAGNIPTSSWTDTDVAPNVTYCYWVQGKNGAGAGTWSSGMTGRLLQTGTGALLLLLLE